MLRLSELDFGPEETQRVVEVLQSEWLTMGQVTEAFEAAFAAFLDVKHAIAVTNGTAALHLAHHAQDIGPGDEVIVPALSFVATANSVLYTGATPVFADIIGDSDFSIDPEDIARKITPRTKGIVAMHYAGYPAAMDDICHIADKHGLYIIEDAAHAPGTVCRGRKAGTIGDIGCFSFFSNKNMVTGEGGMMVTDNDQLAERLRKARSHGMTSLTWDRMRGHAHTYDVIDLGFNYRIDELRAALGLAQLERLERNNRLRRDLMEKYLTAFRQSSMICFPFGLSEQDVSYHICPVLLTDGILRASYMDAMRIRGIQTSIHYPPIHLFSYYRDRFGYTDGMLPITESVAQREVTLPLYPGMDHADVQHVVDMTVEVLTTLSRKKGA